MKYLSYLNTAAHLLSQYNGDRPFTVFSKDFFRQHSKYGSKDRRHITHLCYCYFRLGKAFQDMPLEDRIVAGLFLCSIDPHELLENTRPVWNHKTGLTLFEKFELMALADPIHAIFPWEKELSNNVDAEEFVKSLFVQPDLFIRMRPGHEEKVKEKLTAAGYAFNIVREGCISLPNTSKLDEVLELDKEAVIQDSSSQRIGEFFRIALKDLAKPVKAWDCCAASGGKSIMLYDIDPSVQLTVSDIRESILSNLNKRFGRAGIKNFVPLLLDLSKQVVSDNLPATFPLIIADVPCTGSGTWGRTPEQLYSFTTEKLSGYVLLQKKIMSTVVLQLQPGGKLVYITCSVFKQENEEMIEFIKTKFNLELQTMGIIKGYDEKADTMFVAILQQP